MKPRAVVKTKQRPGWLRFGTRSILFLMLSLAVLFAWVGEDFIRHQVQDPVVERLEAAGGTVYYDYQVQNASFVRDAGPPPSSFSRSLFSEKFRHEVAAVIWGRSETPEDATIELGKLSGLEVVWLSGKEVTDPCVDDLLRISNLQSLSLNQTTLSPAAFGRLAESPKLRHISIGKMATEQHLAELEGFSKLESLVLNACSITDAGLESLGRVTSLRELRIDSCPGFAGAGVTELSSLTNLELLRVTNGQLSDQEMPAISRLKSLQSLELHGLGITDSGIEHLTSITGIKELDVSRTSIGDRAAETISKFSQLENLALDGTQLTDKGIEHLCKMKSLRRLEITGTKVTDRGLHKLASIESLLILDVQIDACISDAGIEKFRILAPDCYVRSWWVNGNSRRLFEAK